VGLQKITGPDQSGMTGFVVVDLDGAEHADGVVRSARKILVDGARTMARSRTYAWALLGQKVSGASAGVSVDAAGHDAGIAAFVEAVRERVASGELALDAGKGVSEAELTALREVDRRNPVSRAPGTHGVLADELLATSALAAAAAAVGGLAGVRVSVEGAGPALPALLGLLGTAGARVVAVGLPSGTITDPDGFDTDGLLVGLREHGDNLPSTEGSGLAATEVLTIDSDLLFCGSRMGLVDHGIAESLPHRLVVPIGTAPVTAKGLAVAGRRGINVLADFLTTSGPLHAFRAEPSAAGDQLLAQANEHAASLTAELLDHPEGAYLGACYKAEEFLRSWQESLPFGRPLA
jgi:hypothetical protein